MTNKTRMVIICGAMALNLALLNIFRSEIRVGLYWAGVTAYWMVIGLGGNDDSKR